MTLWYEGCRAKLEGELVRKRWEATSGETAKLAGMSAKGDTACAPGGRILKETRSNK